MNQFFRNPGLRSADLPPTTQAAEGLARRRWSVAEIEALTKAGVLDEGERFELIGGEIVPMAPRSLPHEQIRVALNLWFVLNSPDPVCVAGCTTFRLSDDSFVEPDFVFFRKADGLAALAPKRRCWRSRWPIPACAGTSAARRGSMRISVSRNCG